MLIKFVRPGLDKLPNLDKLDGVPGKGKQVLAQRYDHNCYDVLGLEDAGDKLKGLKGAIDEPEYLKCLEMLVGWPSSRAFYRRRASGPRSSEQPDLE